MISYLPLVAIFVLMLGAAILVLLRIFKQRMAFSWLTATGTAALSWLLVMFSRSQQPNIIPVISWSSLQAIGASPDLRVDAISWPYAMAVTTLLVAVLLTDLVRVGDVDWSAWAGSLALTAVSLVAVLSGNLLTLIIAWAAIDLIELLVLLWHVEKSASRELIVAAFTARVASILLLNLSVFLASDSTQRFAFEALSPQTSIYLIAAAGLRLGVVPLHLPIFHEFALRRSMGTLVRLGPVVSSLVLLARVAGAGLADNQALVLLAIAGLLALVAGFAWIGARDELEGRPFWILGMAALAVAATVRGQPAASLAWGMGLLLSGGVLFLASNRQQNLLPIFGLSLLAITALPYTPAWNGAEMYTSPFSPWMLLFPIPHALLIVGYIRHALRRTKDYLGFERWVQFLYPTGLILLVLVHYGIFWIGILPSNFSAWPQLTLGRVWPGVLSIGLGVGWWAVLKRFPRVPDGFKNFLRSSLSLVWLYRLLWAVYKAIGQVVDLVSGVLEGDGGVLWALLLLTLLLAVLSQSAAGGL